MPTTMQSRTVNHEAAIRKRRMANELRDTINWIAVFEEEYDLPAEVVVQLRQRLTSIAEQLNHI